MAEDKISKNQRISMPPKKQFSVVSLNLLSRLMS